MAELNRIDDQITTADIRGTSDVPSRRGLTEWIEGDRLTSTSPVGPSLVQNDLANAQNRWASVTPYPAEAENAPGIAAPLLPEAEIGDLRSRWSNIQAEFVDEPRRSVQEADKLVAATMQRLADGFATERASLEKQWDSGDNVSTEDLRVALQRYRAFFGRLLHAA